MSSAFSSPSPIVGRANETAEVIELLEQHRVVTVWGPAGMGKSRLAMHVAEVLRARGGAVVFAELAGAAERDELFSLLAHALGLSPPRGARTATRWTEHLSLGMKQRPRTVLVLDNVEQIVEPAAALIAALSASLPQTSFLVTSREPLRIAPERVYELHPLGLPAPGSDPLSSDAVRLLIERAGRSGGARAVSASDLVVYADIVRELEGVPLAIELAAGRLGVLGAQGLSSRLARRLDVLDRGRRDMPERQATLRGAVAWSWRLLPERERETLAGCALFRGSFDLEAAYAVLERSEADVLDAISDLRDKSLLRSHVEPGRFALFESVRAFADEHLSPERRRRLELRHTAHFVSRAEKPNAHDLENFVAGTRAALAAGSPSEALKLCLAVDTIVSRRGPLGHHAALLDRTLEAAEPAGVDGALVTAALLARGRTHAMAGRSSEAARDFERAVALAKDEREPGLVADVHMQRGLFLHRERRLAEAGASYERAVEIFCSNGDAMGHGRALGNLGAVAHDGGDLELASRRYAQAITLLRHAGERRIVAILEGNLALLEQERGELDAAEVRFERAIEELEEEGDRRLLAITVGNLGGLLHERRKLEEARRAEERALGLLLDLGDTRSEAIARSRLGAVLCELRQVDAGAAMLTSARKLIADAEDRLAHAIVDVHEAFVELASARAELEAGQEGRAHVHLANVRERVAAALAREDGHAPSAETCDDVRVAVRILERGLVELAVSHSTTRTALIVEKEGRWLRLGAAEVEWLDNRRAPRLILLALARARDASPGRGLPLEDLFSAGWPAERVLPEARENRVNVALAWLRRGCLRPLLLKTSEGYFLDPEVPLLWTDRDPRSDGRQ